TILSGKTTRDYIENFKEMFWAEAYNKGVIIFNEYKETRNNEDLKEAVESFENTKLVKSDEIQTYSILVTCYSLLEDYEKAMENASKALELKPDDFQPNLAMGTLLVKQDKRSEALTYLEKAVEIDPSNSYAVRQLATAYYDLNFSEKSIETFEKAINSETDKKIKADLYFNLGVLNMRIKDFGKAEDNFLAAYDLNPDDAEALVGMAQTFENAEKWSRAEKFYRELIALEPDKPDHYKGMARVLIKQGDPDRATRYFEKSKTVGN
ncbi:MAG: tetratricopeptide repeat protein, partial [Candidatus Neomarinimicrobiota bacterium]